jgi:hypothetical protein
MRLVPEHSPLPRLLVFPFGILAVGGLILAWTRPALLLGMAHCPLRDLTGIPCPTCGGTHAALALAHGRFATAFTANPLVAVGLVLLGLWLLWGVLATLVPPLRRQMTLSAREKRTARILAVLLLGATWIWEILRS